MASVGLQIGLELTNILPVRKIIEDAGTAVIQFARDLRRAGSDIVVEQDLADTFGNVRLATEVETTFRDIVKHEDLRPISTGDEAGSLSDIALKTGAGPTVRHALASQNRAYIATVVQLSFLAATQHRQSLAAAISESMEKRVEANIPSACPSPGLEGILNSLVSINRQTTLFPWQVYTKTVEQRLERGVGNFVFHPGYMKIAPAALLGVLDAVPLIQSLPKSRRIAISNPTGCIVLIVWMHFILNLDVSVVGPNFEPVTFGRPSDGWFQVIIHWDPSTNIGLEQTSTGAIKPQPGYDAAPPELILQDSDAQILLKTFPRNAGRRQITTTVRHSVEGWGTQYLARFLNKSALMKSDNPVYRSVAVSATAIALVVSRFLYRGGEYEAAEITPSVPIVLEYWRIMAAARVLFDGIPIEEELVSTAIAEVERQGFQIGTVQNPFLYSQSDEAADDSQTSFIEVTKDMACYLLPFAFIADIEQCAAMPITMESALFFEPWLETNVNSVCNQFYHWHAVQETDALRFLSALMSDDQESPPDTSTSGDIFLVSYSGWSMFWDIVGEKDPAKVRMELIHVQEGTPTKVATGEQRSCLEDGLRVGFPLPPPLGPEAADSKTLDVRTIARVMRRREVWSTQLKSFDLVVEVTADYSSEAIDKMKRLFSHGIVGEEWQQRAVSPFMLTFGYRDMQRQLWKCHVTPAGLCKHAPARGRSFERPPLLLGGDAMVWFSLAIIGRFDPADPNLAQRITEKVRVFPTRGSVMSRWQVIGRGPNLGRQCMLRHERCCEECAIQHALALPGKWDVVL